MSRFNLRSPAANPMQLPSKADDANYSRSTFFGNTILLMHLVGAIGAWWLLPMGFPVTHPRFWSNQILPFTIAAVVLWGFFARWRRWKPEWGAALIAFSVAWIVGSVSFRLIFPVSAAWIWLIPLMFGAWIGWSAFRMRAFHAVQGIGVLLAATSALTIGMAVPISQRGPPPTTQPSNAPFAEFSDKPESVNELHSVYSRNGAQIFPDEGVIQVAFENRRVRVDPLLTFGSRSPDRCWTVLARSIDRNGPPRRLVVADMQDSSGLFEYRSDMDHRMQVQVDGLSVQIDAMARLHQPVYSHLNSYCQFELTGFQRLALSFSPCATVPIEVTVADYPVGRPRRLAFLDRERQFQVVEATSGEKGPFRQLAIGSLLPDEPLVITIHEGPRAIGRITLQDWARQVSTELSPTAGWNLPMNAIEFCRFDPSADFAMIFITLAGTSVGRGWDSVGHSAGVYRNRISVEPVSD